MTDPGRREGTLGDPWGAVPPDPREEQIMPEEHEALTLANFGNGGAAEVFEEYLNAVLENIQDINTEARAKRVITLKFEFIPDGERAGVETRCTGTVKLAPMNAANGQVYVGRRQGKVVAVLHDPHQLQLEWAEQDRPRNIEEKRAAGE